MLGSCKWPELLNDLLMWVGSGNRLLVSGVHLGQIDDTGCSLAVSNAFLSVRPYAILFRCC
jgi:hypothetical protein